MPPLLRLPALSCLMALLPTVALAYDTPSPADSFAAVIVRPVLDEAEAAQDFSGTWMASLCPKGVKAASGQCGNFVLELVQDDDRICGTHVFATAGAREVDEGTPPSIHGVIEAGVARITLESRGSHPPKTAIQLQAELSRTKRHLLWRSLDNTAGQLLPVKATLTRSEHDSLMNPLFAQQMRAACAGTPSPEPAPAPVRS